MLYFDYFVTMLFVIEITYKIFIYKKPFFKGDWNLFDFIVTLGSFIAMVVHLLDLNLGALDNVVVLRTLRLFRFFKIIHIIPNVDKIARDFKNAIRVTSSILIFGFVIILVIGIILCTMYKEVDPTNFGDPLVSIYSVFRIFSVEGWYEIPDGIASNTSYLNATFIRILFSLLVLFGTFVFGFVISSISDELAADNNDELIQKTDELKDEIKILKEKMNIIINKIEK